MKWRVVRRGFWKSIGDQSRGHRVQMMMMMMTTTTRQAGPYYVIIILLPKALSLFQGRENRVSGRNLGPMPNLRPPALFSSA